MAQTKVSLIKDGVIVVGHLHTNHGITTNHIGEGSNLYFTDARVMTSLGSISTHIIPDTDITYDLGSATNRFRDLYLSGNTIHLGGDTKISVNNDGEVEFKDSLDAPKRLKVRELDFVDDQGRNKRFKIDATSGRLATFDAVGTLTADKLDLSAMSTTDLSEGSNLYYTDSRVGTYLTTNNYATQSYVQGQVSNLVASAPSTLDTLNELAAALGDDPNFATTVSNQIGTKWTQDNAKIANWDAAFGWGNHASVGYLTTVGWNDVTGKPATFAPSAHNHDDRYYTESESDARFINASGDTMTGTLTLSSISGTDQVVENTYGAYLHLGAWAVGRTASNAVLVNTAYRADYADALFDMNISRFTNDAGYQLASSAITTSNIGSQSVNNADKVDGYHETSFFRSDLGQIGNNDLAFGVTTGFPNQPRSGAYTVDHVGHSSTLAVFNSSGSANTAALQFHYNGDMYVHVNVDGNQWQSDRVWTSQNFDPNSKLNTTSKAADSNLLDGIDSSQFLRSDVDDTISGKPTFAKASSGTLASRTGYSDFIGYNPSYGSYIGGRASNAAGYIYAGGYYSDGSTVHTLIHSGNIGSQSVNYSSSAGSVAWSNVSSKPAGWLNNAVLIEDKAPGDTAFPSGFYQNYNGSGNPTGTWFNYINVRHSNTGNGHGYQLGMSYYDNNLWFRSYQGGTSPTFQSWETAIGSGGTNQTKSGYLQSNSSLRAPIFYDSDDTSRYINPNGQTVLNSGSGYETLIVTGEYPQVTIRRTSTPDASIHYDAGYAKKWNVGPGAGGAEEDEFGFAIYSAPRGTHYGTPMRINAETQNVMIGDADHPSFKLDVRGTIRSTADVRGTIFYDENDTNLYSDPSGTSVLNYVTATEYKFRSSTNNARFNGVSDWGTRLYTDSGYIQFGPANSGHAHIYTDRSNFYFNKQIQLLGVSQINQNDIRTPIFYDSGNTAYYINADATSNLYNLELSGAKHTYLYITPGNGYEAMVRFNGGSGSTWYVGSRTSSQLIGSTDAYHVYSQTTGQTVGGYDSSGHHYAVGSSRAPIFYDLNNTGYFVDANNRSYLNKITTFGINDTDVWEGVITVDGDANTYYPVGWYGGSQSQVCEIEIHRNYSDPAPSTWNTSSHKGGLVFRCSTNFGGWGGVAYDTQVQDFRETYTTMMGWMGHFANSRAFGFRLRGGGGRYYIRIKGRSVAPTVTYGTWDPGNNGTGLGTSTVVDTANIVRRRFASGSRLYSYDNLVLDHGSDHQTKSGILQSNSSLRTPVFYDSNDTNYYLDANNTSRFYNLNMPHLGSGSWNLRVNDGGQENWRAISIAGGASDHIGIGVHGTSRSVFGRDGVSIHFDDTDSFRLHTDGWDTEFEVAGGGEAWLKGGLRASIIYDNNNTGYYSDPASTSYLNVVSMGTQTWRGNINWNTGVNVNISGESSFDIQSSGGIWQVWTAANSQPSIYVTFAGQTQIGQAGNRGLYVYGAITASGDITAFSDARVKTDIKPLEKSLEKVKQIQGVSYKRTDLDPEKEKIGFVAQEIMKVLPEVVTENEDGMYSVSYGNITALLIEAIKEQQKQIDELKKLINK